MNIGVHRTHCCIIHGCKYGDPYCPVVNGATKQKYLCEECINDEMSYAIMSPGDLKEEKSKLEYQLSLIYRELKKRHYE